MKKTNLIMLCLANVIFNTVASDKQEQNSRNARENILRLAQKYSPSTPLTNPNFSYTLEDQTTQCNASITSQGIIANTILQECSFQGGDCPICFATAQLLKDTMKGKTLKIVLDFPLENLLALIKVPLIPGRKKCPATFLDSLKNGIHLYLENHPG